MRVLQVNTESTWRGGERQTVYTVEGLRDAGVDVAVLCRAKSPLHDRLRALDVPVHPVRSQRHAVMVAGSQGRYYDLIHAQSARGQGIAVLGKPRHRKPILYTRRVNFPLHGLSSRLKYAATDRTVAISTAIRDTLHASGVRPVEVIPSAVADRELDTNRARIVIQTAGVPPGTKVIGTVGDLVPQKGPLLMVEVMRELCRLRDDTVLVQFGHDPMGATVMEKVVEYGLEDRVLLLGFMQDVEDMFALFDAYLVTGNATEGLNSSVFDAFMHGVPVVSTLTGGMIDSVADRGLTAEDGDAAALAAHLHRLLDDPALAGSMVERARDWARSHVTVPAITSRYLAVYRQMLEDH